MKRVLVIEDEDFMRRGLIEEITNLTRDSMALGAGTLESAIELIQEHDFDMIFVDPGLPGIDPLSEDERTRVVKKVIELAPEAVIVVITGSDSPHELLVCKSAGASGYIAKKGLDPDKFQQLLAQMDKADFVTMSGEVKKDREYHFGFLTPQEERIINMLINNRKSKSRAEIYADAAQKLGIDQDTVQRYHKRAKSKFYKLGYIPKGAE